MDLLDLLAVEDGGTGKCDHTPVLHILTPDFSTLCRLDMLEATALGDSCRISPHLGRAVGEWVTNDDGSRRWRGWYESKRWKTITCPWCRSLGENYYRHAVRTMQGRA
jgi:hypothetical protein